MRYTNVCPLRTGLPVVRSRRPHTIRHNQLNSMIRRIQALNYRCLRYVDVVLEEFQLLVGPNASGKSTLFDVVAFLGDLVADGLEMAIEKRTPNFQDLVWNRSEVQGFELAIEFDIPKNIQKRLPREKEFCAFRYELSIRENQDREVLIKSERGLLMPRKVVALPPQSDLFPDPPLAPETILHGGGRPGFRTILSKAEKGDSFHSETAEKPGQGWTTNISFGPQRSTLRNLPESPQKFPMATYVKRALEAKVKPLFLNSLKLRQASPPRLKLMNGFAPDGSNLPWAIRRLLKDYDSDYKSWIKHVKIVLSDLAGIRVIDRPEDRHAYLILTYNTGVKIPSWVASDGTLRLIALTLLAYMPDQGENLPSGGTRKWHSPHGHRLSLPITLFCV